MIQDYLGDSLEISSCIKNGKKCVANIKCNIHSQSDVDNFIKIGTRVTNEILKLNFNKGKQRKVCTVCSEEHLQISSRDKVQKQRNTKNKANPRKEPFSKI